MALVTCPDCGREVSDAAPTCPGCGRPVQAAAAATVRRSGCAAGLTGCLVALALGALGVLGFCAVVMNTPVKPTGTSSAPPKPAPLELVTWRWSTSAGGRYVEVEGEVRNVSGAPLDGVQVVASFYDGGNQFITSDSAMVQYQPLLAGQTSPFKVMAIANPAMHTARVEFKKLFGGRLEHRGPAPKPTPTPKGRTKP